MENSKKHLGILNKYIIEKMLNKGVNSSIYLVSNSNKELFVAKVFNHLEEEEGILYPLNPRNEINFLSSINHSNVIKYYSEGVGPMIFDEKEYEKKQYFIMEYAKYLTLFDYVQSGFSEKLTKVICWIVFSTVNDCHKQGIFISDIKLENILVCDDFEIKLSDFGGSCKINPDDYKSKNIEGGVYSEPYGAPEIINIPEENKYRKYNGIQAEIFSLGVLLFFLKAGTKPFENAKVNKYGKARDRWFNLIKKKETKTFDIKASGLNSKYKESSKELKDLFFRMVSYEPSKRPSLDYILLFDEFFKEIRDYIRDNGRLDNLKKELKDELKKRYEIRLEEI